MRMHCCANGVKKSGGIAGQDFGDGGVAEHGVELADACGEFVGRTAAARVLNGLNRPGEHRQRSSGWRGESRD